MNNYHIPIFYKTSIFFDEINTISYIYVGG